MSTGLSSTATSASELTESTTRGRKLKVHKPPKTIIMRNLFALATACCLLSATFAQLPGGMAPMGGMGGPGGLGSLAPLLLTRGGGMDGGMMGMLMMSLMSQGGAGGPGGSSMLLPLLFMRGGLGEKAMPLLMMMMSGGGGAGLMNNPMLMLSLLNGGGDAMSRALPLMLMSGAGGAGAGADPTGAGMGGGSMLAPMLMGMGQ